MSEMGFRPEQIDTTKPHSSRMYNYYLGGWDNYEVDRKAAERVLELAPGIKQTAVDYRDFQRRAVRAVVRRGIRQIIDIGTGIPLSPNVHETAREIAPETRVVYVDNDPIVTAYAGAKLTNAGGTAFVHGDVRDPESILEHPTTRKLIDFDQPVAVLLVAVLHFVQDADDPEGIVAALTERTVEGSCLVQAHVTADFDGDGVLQRVGKVYEDSTAGLVWRDHDSILPMFKGFELMEPGLVQSPLWRPDGPLPQNEELRDHLGYGGVGVKGGV